MISGIMQQDVVAGLALRAEPIAPQDVLRLVLDQFGRKVALSSSFGAEDMVLIDMLMSIDPLARIFTLDTGRLPQETYSLMDATRERYGAAVEVFFPQAEAVQSMVAAHGLNLFYHSVENRQLCCGVRKMEPLRRALAGLDAWITGLRREQSMTRTDARKIEWDDANRLVKVNPLVDWSHEDVWRYIREHNVPYNALHDRGYPSIGCAPCTRAVQPGEHERAGRWWWEHPETRECGLHVSEARSQGVRESGVPEPRVRESNVQESKV
jgi:phosphoadenosine phosphosulfate reductase